MPDLTEDEADRCPHCGAILREPPNCCEAARNPPALHWEVRECDGCDCERKEEVNARPDDRSV